MDRKSNKVVKIKKKCKKGSDKQNVLSRAILERRARDKQCIEKMGKEYKYACTDAILKDLRYIKLLFYIMLL